MLNGEAEADKLFDYSDDHVDTLRGGDGDDKLYCNDNQQQNPDFNFGEGGDDAFEQDDIDAVLPQTDVTPPEVAAILPPTPDLAVGLQVAVGW